jgi:Calcineurin-like phosphoesterase
MAQPELSVKTAEGDIEHQTRRGDILIFGGDEVYPTASRRAYDERLVRPYEAALRITDEPHPHAYAIPGNHDWYDSLVSFTRLFTSKRWFAGWRTQQSRSYFALKLPFGWWLVGPDVQLGSDIDRLQVAYFKEVANHMEESDRIILCNAEPFWIYEGMYRDYDEEVYNQSNLRFLEDKVLGRKISVFISGDLHHYRRHEGEDGAQKITAGGGSAFLHPTHGPDVSKLAGGFHLRKSFPDEKTSRKLCWNNFKFPFMHKTFGIMVGFLYLLTAWVALVNLELHKADSIGTAMKLVAWSLFENPYSLFWVVAVFAGFYLFTDTHSKPYRFIAGSIHGLAHLFAIFTIGWGANFMAFSLTPLSLSPLAQILLAGALIFVGGGFVGPLIMGAYLFVSLNLFGRHSNEAFSSLACEDYKNFLRLKIEPSGKLTIFPIGIRRAPRSWKDRPQGAVGPELVPNDPKATVPELIEGPIYILENPLPGKRGATR